MSTYKVDGHSVHKTLPSPERDQLARDRGIWPTVAGWLVRQVMPRVCEAQNVNISREQIEDADPMPLLVSLASYDGPVGYCAQCLIGGDVPTAVAWAEAGTGDHDLCRQALAVAA